MKPNLLHKSLLAGCLALVSGYSLQAIALPLEPFSFHQSSGFLVDNTLVGTGGNNIGWYQFASLPAPPAGEYNTLAWGVPITNSGRGLLAADPFTPDPGNGNINTDLSGIRVVGHQGTITTGVDLGGGNSDWGGWQSISTVYHQNRAINSIADTLLATVLRSTLTFDHSGGDIASDTNSIAVAFNETLNSLPCGSGNPNGSVCDDLFTFNLGTFAPISYVYGGHTYQVEFNLANFSNSSTNFPTCPGGDCTIWTAENVTSSLDVQARIREVPEPATLALLGLGLLGLGFSKRRRLNG